MTFAGLPEGCLPARLCGEFFLFGSGSSGLGAYSQKTRRAEAVWGLQRLLSAGSIHPNINRILAAAAETHRSLDGPCCQKRG
jgi:hypothetical protein